MSRLSVEQENALGCFLHSLGVIERYSKAPLFDALEMYHPRDEEGMSVPGYFTLLNWLDAETKRDIVFRICENLNTETIPIFMLRYLRSSLVADTPFCDGPMYLMLNFFENCLRYISPEIGKPSFENVHTKMAEIQYKCIQCHPSFQEFKELQSKIGMETGEFGSGNLTIYIPTGILRVLFPSLNWFQPPKQEQIDTIVTEFIQTDSIPKEARPFLEYNIRPEFKGTFSGVLVLEFTGIVFD